MRKMVQAKYGVFIYDSEAEKTVPHLTARLRAHMPAPVLRAESTRTVKRHACQPAAEGFQKAPGFLREIPRIVRVKQIAFPSPIR